MCTLALGIEWAELNNQTTTDARTNVAIASGISFVVILIAYLILRRTVLMNVVEADHSERSVLGGIWLSSAAQDSRKQGRTRQEIFARLNYNPEFMFTTPSRIAGELALALFYVLLLASAVVSLTAVGFLIEGGPG